MNDAIFDALMRLTEEDPRRSEICALFGARSMSGVLAALVINENREAQLKMLERLLAT
jgi:hypothetical protein